MNNNKANLSYLLVSAATLLFYITVIPLADGVTTYLNNRINVGNTKLQAKVNEILPPPEEPTVAHAVGFQVPSEEDYEEDEE